MNGASLEGSLGDFHWLGRVGIMVLSFEIHLASHKAPKGRVEVHSTIQTFPLPLKTAGVRFLKKGVKARSWVGALGVLGA